MSCLAPWRTESMAASAAVGVLLLMADKTA
jgi:hypothetical protein